MNLLPTGLRIEEIESRDVLKKLTSARAALAELKGIAGTIPNERILIDTLALQEAKDSSEIESIVTTHDELYRSDFGAENFVSTAAKEVYRYADALKLGFDHVRKNGFIHLNLIRNIQERIEGNSAGIRKQPGTKLVNDQTKETVYTPPQDHEVIMELMTNLEQFINGQIVFDTDPLIRMAIIHHQFESIHPFYDGNGRTGRIINILFLIQQGLLNLPILYLSRYIIRNRQQYYELLQTTRDTGNWQPWILYMLDAVEKTASETMVIVTSIKELMLRQKDRIRTDQPRMYSQDLINTLFRHPYTKIKQVERDLHVSRLTASKYLETLSEMGILTKIKVGRSNYYINDELYRLLMNRTVNR